MQNEFYVYTLAYPDGTVFYVGKGTGYRIDAHEREARNGIQSYKCNVIRKIWDEGGRILKSKMAFFGTEDEAYQFEQHLISFFGRENLANLTDGGEGGEGGSRSGAGRPHNHEFHVCVEIVNAYGMKDFIYTGDLRRSNEALGRAEHIAAHHVGEQARSVRILKRFCCIPAEPTVIKVVK